MKHAAFVFVAIAIASSVGLTANAQPSHVCEFCSNTIEGAYFETRGNFYHPEHFTCDLCFAPITGKYTVHRGKNYHDMCFEKHVALRCAVCDGIVQGEYLLDQWGNAYHKHHQNDVTMCDFCHRFITGEHSDGMKSFRDGRHLCATCGESSVTDAGDAETLMEDIADELRRFGIHIDCSSIEFFLVDRNKLRRLSGNYSHTTTGFTDYTVRRNLFGKVRGQRTRVYILEGMPRVEMTGTMAHELMHVWQFRNAHLRQDKWLSEGSCNYAAFLVLRKTGGSDADFIMEYMLKNEDPVYGEGFRRVKRYVEKHGLAAWLDLLREKSPSVSAR